MRDPAHGVPREPAAPPVAVTGSWLGDAATAGLVGLAAGLLLAWALVWRQPHIGFDFQYFLPRLIDVRLHQLREGWFSVQWWTPSFGGGIPAFPNPQHTQFMLAQFLVPGFGPWGAAVAQAAVFNAIGAALVCWVCRRRFGSSVAASVLAAATFATSGFMWEHTLSGHMGFNVTRIADVRDDEVFLQRASSLRPYEPIFGYGYGGAQLPHHFEAGTIDLLLENPSGWRFNDPRTFLRGSSSPAVTPLAATEEPALRALLAHRQPAWPWPAIATPAWAATGAAVVALILCLAFPSCPSRVRTPRFPPALPASP